ncbi:hypothetical protein [Streptomyces sp. DG1A-41]|uniref:hypothetical protein n=1 Tax=Streptomyces sp. DG1A-41 TaxID=3125779 RepID=UPI0030CFA525
MSAKTEAPHVPEIFELVRDVGAKKIGEVRGKEGPYYQLRPVGGGREWDARPENIRELTPEERVRAKVRTVNRRSSGY